MWPTETRPAANRSRKSLDELLHAIPCLLRLLLQLLLHPVHLRLDRLLQLRPEAGGPRGRVLAVLLQRALRPVALQPQEPRGLVAALAHDARGGVAALAQLPHDAVAGDGAAP